MEVDTTPVKQKTTTPKPRVTRPWQVILYNDDIHSIDEVILQVQKGTRCALTEATRITMEAHFKGKAVAFKGDFAECHRVAGVLREIGLMVEIQG